MQHRKGFTLIELLIVVGILAILSIAAVAVLNPAQQLARARDAKRITEIDTIDKSIMLYQTQGGASFGAANTVYISLPDSSSTCATYSATLPTLPAGYSYACATPANYRNTNGTGWIPINLSSVTGVSMPVLPIDPINSAVNGQYYSYIGGSWELTANMESSKWLLTASSDGGDSVSFERGTNILLSPVLKTSFSFSSFPTTVSPNQPAWRSLSGANTPVTGSDSEGDYVRITGGSAWYEYQENIPFNPRSKYKLTCRIRQIVDPTVGGKNFYCGVSGIASDGTTYINNQGLNTSSSQHYVAAAGSSLAAGAGYTTYTGYFRGHSTTGVGGTYPNQNSPGPLYSGIAYIRPMFILNYSSGNGTADIEFEMLEVIE